MEKVYYSRQVTITPEELLNETVDVAGEKLNKLNLEITANGKELLYWHAEPDEVKPIPELPKLLCCRRNKNNRATLSDRFTSGTIQTRHL